ncbi:Hydroxymethylpyrimidine ABC transporter, ATPase component [Caenispirillum salinarum AK4]|uniref:Hydroxymethylpyrimidine ABC transporter, ATPase component n=1 Tax=Caenispirillum salinarum AK4 TaxID=1238182 RepID=K9HKJ5_9PROT|nr:ABC transporter ATP-binding protein [Caenispirillum salinarum]EKV30898.1 Hydroxymethylpyrimidine ABC transporter, ATPase component [Caenispirillum salinarum AK4]
MTPDDSARSGALPFTKPSSADTAPEVRVHAARLDWHGVPLFDALDFTMPAGRWTCLLGPSGVGKSTLLRLIAGLAPPHADSRVTCGTGQSLEGRVAYMAQTDLLLPWATVLENVMLGARLRGEKPDTRRARDLLQAVGLHEAADKRPAELSGGMRQRAALARTLMEDRPVILMDEPFSALDAVSRLRLQDLAARALEGRTVLLVTHDPLEALRLGHRVHVLSGRPARLDAPLTPEGPPPRKATDPALLALHADLLARLEAADAEVPS